jgi:hypothetical protein
MNFKRDLLLGVGALVSILLIVCFGSIGLFARMSPAIENVLQENDVSLAATEEMLAVLALDQNEAPTPAATSRFKDALERVRANVTESAEQPEIKSIDRSHEAALGGDSNARRQTVEALQRLAQINRAAMHHANDDVQRLGWAGAWATVILCVLGFSAALVVTRRLDRRIAHPISELYATLEAALAGDTHRRCVQSGAQNEVWFLMQSVNQLLDRCAVPEERPKNEVEPQLRAAVRHLLDEAEDARVLLDKSGHIVAASRLALDRLNAADSVALGLALDRAIAGEVVAPVQDRADVGQGATLCTLSGVAAG